MAMPFVPPRHLSDVPTVLAWLRARGAQELETDSRQLLVSSNRKGQVFMAWPGRVHDGRRYVEVALAHGAVACLVEAQGLEAFSWPDDERIGAVWGLKDLAGPIADAFLGHPSRGLSVLAITGTNGKTSTSWWLAQALGSQGLVTGVIGTLGAGIPPDVDRTGLTTPDAVTLQVALRSLSARRCQAVAVEASSIGMVEQRLAGTSIAVAILTNFTQDHLDYHGSMAAYWAAKAALFQTPGLQAAVINTDDERGRALAASWVHRSALWTYGLTPGARPRLCAQSLSHQPGGMAFEVLEYDEFARQVVHQVSILVPVIGAFNVLNILAVIGGMRALGFSLDVATQACSHLTPVPGRMARASTLASEPVVIIDYAHTPDALDKALGALRPLAESRKGALWCVFGCGGQRDALKRPLMARVAQQQADRVMVTSDNPRDESPQAIVNDIVRGWQGGREALWIEIDRAAAIVRTIQAAAPEDVVLIAGKGHESYQEVSGIQHPFSDMTLAQQALRALQGAVQP